MFTISSFKTGFLKL